MVSRSLACGALDLPPGSGKRVFSRNCFQTRTAIVWESSRELRFVWRLELSRKDLNLLLRPVFSRLALRSFLFAAALDCCKVGFWQAALPPEFGFCDPRSVVIRSPVLV